MSLSTLSTTSAVLLAAAGLALAALALATARDLRTALGVLLDLLLAAGLLRLGFLDSWTAIAGPRPWCDPQARRAALSRRTPGRLVTAPSPRESDQTRPVEVA